MVMTLMDHASYAIEPTAGPKTVAGRERANSLQEEDLQDKAEAIPRNTEE